MHLTIILYRNVFFGNVTNPLFPTAAAELRMQSPISFCGFPETTERKV